MARRGKGFIDDEPDLWDRAMADVAPIKGRKPTSKPAGETIKTRSTPAVPAASPAQATPNKTPQGRDIDARTQQRLQRGQLPIEAVLDLHGHGQGQAYERLVAFLQQSYGRDLRCVLVITGKGKMGGGILRARLPEWVDEPPLQSIVLKAVSAKGQHGGAGAFYILLRRRRSL